MSDIDQDDKPWNLISDSRAHRCQPPARKKLGRRFTCDCGTEFQYSDTRFGGQWLPIASVVPVERHGRKRSLPIR